jgi:hypothetical protein
MTVHLRPLSNNRFRGAFGVVSDANEAGSGAQSADANQPLDAGGEAMSPATPNTRELAARESNGVYVQLLWNPDENAVTVAVEGARLGDQFQLAVAPDRALDAFYHPFAYAA